MKPIQIVNRRDYQRSLATYLANEEVQAYTMAILSFFALAFFSIFAIRPTLISFFTLQKQIDDATIIENALDNKINALLRSQEMYQLHQNEIALLDEAIPNEPLFPELLKNIENIVVENEATMTAFTTEEFSLLRDRKQEQVLNDENISSVDFGFTVAPTFTQAEGIITRLMNLRRMISMVFFSAEAKDARSDNPADTIIETSINGSAFYVSGPDGGTE